MDRTRDFHAYASSVEGSVDAGVGGRNPGDEALDAPLSVPRRGVLHSDKNIDHASTWNRHANATTVSPSIVRSGEILRQIIAFENLLASAFDRFVGYHQYVDDDDIHNDYDDDGNSVSMSRPPASRAKSGPMGDAERAALNAEITRFVAAVGAELKDMRTVTTRENQLTPLAQPPCSSAQCRTHVHEVQADLAARLARLTQRCQTMHRERAHMSKFNSPFCFYGTDGAEGGSNAGSGSSGEYLHEALSLSSSSASAEEQRSSTDEINNNADQGPSRDSGSLLQRMAKASSTKSSPGSGVTGVDLGEPLGADFAVRYEGQIAPAAQLKQYESLASHHKTALLKEAKLMHVRYGEDLQNARKLEGSVNTVGSLMTEFAHILASQSENLEEVHAEGKAATAHVKSSAEELQLTIDRSESSANNIVMLSVGLAFLLLFLDYITP